MGIEELCEMYNTCRVHYQNREFKGNEIKAALSGIGFPKGGNFRTCAAKLGLIYKTGKGYNTVWHFAKEPVHISKIENVLKEYRTYSKKFYKKPQPTGISYVSEEESVNNAITLLKSLGYKIQKQVITYEEV